MRTVHLYIFTTIKGKAASGACGYVLALEKDGEIVHPINYVFQVHDKTMQTALLETMAQAIARIHEPVKLHIWTDEQMIAAPFTLGWIEKWIAEEFANRKNADEWRAFLGLCLRKEIDVRQIQFHIKEPHPFRKLLRWECEKENKEGIYGERSEKHRGDGHHGTSRQSTERPGRSGGTDRVY